MIRRMKIISFILIILIIHNANSTLGPGDKKNKKSSKTSKNSEKSDKDDNHNDEISKNIVNKSTKGIPVFDLGLIKSDANTKEIIDNHANYCAECSHDKLFRNKVLGYVTPWNSKGYDIAKIFANKLDLISPVWLQIQRTGRNKYKLTGTHDIDKGWMKDIRNSSDSSHQQTEIMPRILFENLQTEDLHAIFNNEEEKQAFAAYLVRQAREYKFDGYVLEIFSQLGGYAKFEIQHLIMDLADALHDAGKKLIVVIPPVVRGKISKDGFLEDEVLGDKFTKEDFDILKEKIDYFSLMTYDYPLIMRTVATNAPLVWIKRNIKYLTNEKKYRAKILMGLNFYGYHYELTSDGKLKQQPEPVLGRQLIELLNEGDWRMRYDESSKEHGFQKISDSVHHVIYYPTLYSISLRIKLAKELGTGLSIWETGQGLDYFYDIM